MVFDAHVDADRCPVLLDELQRVGVFLVVGRRDDREGDALAVRTEPEAGAVALCEARLVEVRIRRLRIVLSVLLRHCLVIELRARAGRRLIRPRQPGEDDLVQLVRD